MKNIYLPNQVAPSHSPCTIAWDKLSIVIPSNEFGLMKFQAFGWPTMPHEDQPLADVVNEKSNRQYFDGYAGNDLPATTESSNNFLNEHTAFEGFYDTDELLHKKPYESLVHAMYRDTDEESIADIKAYCEDWYPAMKTCPWHDGHTRMTDTDGDYFGYWAFEADAVAFLLDIDDSTIEHMVYPKDLVAYARKLRDEGEKSPGPDYGRLRGLRNEIVPKTGWWHSLARPNGQALHYFEAGQHFPDWQFTKTGEVIWDFDPDKQAPPPEKK